MERNLQPLRDHIEVCNKWNDKMAPLLLEKEQLLEDVRKGEACSKELLEAAEGNRDALQLRYDAARQAVNVCKQDIDDMLKQGDGDVWHRNSTVLTKFSCRCRGGRCWV